MAAKAKGLKSLVGKQVLIHSRYTDSAEGPFTLLNVDFPYIGLEVENQPFWWHTNIIEGIREVTATNESE